jgi:hypothetical protein
MAARPDSLHRYVTLLRSGAGVCPQLAQNVDGETLLGPCCWNDLDARAAASMTADEAVTCLQSWGIGHQRHGPVLTPPLPPALARAIPDSRFLHMVAAALEAAGLGALTPEELRPLLEAWKWLDPADPGLARYRELIPLGRYLIWAKYNESDPKADPVTAFNAAIPEGGAAVLDAAGLDAVDAAATGAREAWIVCYTLPEGVPLHTPTIADAGPFSLFRPSKRTAGLPGTTAPPLGQARHRRGRPRGRARQLPHERNRAPCHPISRRYASPNLRATCSISPRA